MATMCTACIVSPALFPHLLHCVKDQPHGGVLGLRKGEENSLTNVHFATSANRLLLSLVVDMVKLITPYSLLPEVGCLMNSSCLAAAPHHQN